MSNDVNIKALTDNELLKLIKKDDKYLDYIYKTYKTGCIRYMQKNHSGHLTGPDFEDIYHDALFALTRNIHKEGFNLTSTLKTYLISICNNLCLKAGKRTMKLKYETDIANPITASIDIVSDSKFDTLDEIKLAFTPQGKALKIALKILEDSGPRCYELLTMYFGFKDKRGALDELTEYFDYKNSDYTKNQKSRCKKTLTELTLENLNN